MCFCAHVISSEKGHSQSCIRERAIPLALRLLLSILELISASTCHPFMRCLMLPCERGLSPAASLGPPLLAGIYRANTHSNAGLLSWDRAGPTVSLKSRARGSLDEECRDEDINGFLVRLFNPRSRGYWVSTLTLMLPFVPQYLCIVCVLVHSKTIHRWCDMGSIKSTCNWHLLSFLFHVLSFLSTRLYLWVFPALYVILTEDPGPMPALEILRSSLSVIYFSSSALSLT